MLQLEHDRAQKKIDETTSKAVKLEQLKTQNDQKYIQMLQHQQYMKMMQKMTANGEMKQELRLQQVESVKQAKYNSFQKKKLEATQLKEKLRERRNKLQNDHDMEFESKKERSKNIKQQVEYSQQNYRDFYLKRKQKLQDDFKVKTNKEKIRIYELEKQAQELEKQEEDLIKELQATQEEEKQAYKDLEEAML